MFTLHRLSSLGGRRVERVLVGAARGIVHGSQKPAADASIDFSELGLRYVPSKKPEVIVNKTFWTPPPGAEEKLVHEDIPFAVDRTMPGKSLPVYTDYKGGGTKVVTIVRKCRGDMQMIHEALQTLYKPLELLGELMGLDPLLAALVVSMLVTGSIVQWQFQQHAHHDDHDD